MLQICNPSNTFDIQARLHALSSNVVQIGGVNGDMGEWVLQPKEERSVPVTIRLPAPGLIKEHLSLENLTARQDPVHVSITILRHDEAVSAQFDPNSEGTLCLPVSAVARGEDGSLHLCSDESAALTIRNGCSKDLVLTADLNDFPVQFGEKEDGSDTYVATLKASQSQAVPWTLTAVPPLRADQVQTILQHGAATLQTTAEVRVAKVVDTAPYNVFHAFSRRQTPAVGQCVLLVPVVVSLAMSEGFAKPTHINLGAVGLADGRRHDGRDSLQSDATKCSAKILLVNMSSYLPLRLQVECQPTIRFSSTRIEIPPGSSVEVEATLQLQLIPSQGPFRYEAFFVNELNPENDIAVSFTGQHYWKVFRLTAGENEGVNESVSLPPLRLESFALSSILSEVKWNVTATEQGVQLDVHIQHNPKLENIVELLALNYDATASIEKLTFQSDSNANEGGGGGDSLASSGVTAQSATSRHKGALSTNRTHRMRLRCVLRESSLAKLVNIFFGFKSKKQAEIWEFSRVAEIEKRLRTSASHNIWLGTVIFSNPLTDDEEIQVFGKLDPFSTFSMPSKLLVRPVRVRPASMAAVTLDADDNASVATYYVGEVTVNNICEGYVAQLSLQVLFSDHLSIPLRVEVTTTSTGFASESPQGETGRVDREAPDSTTAFTSSSSGTKANSNPLKSEVPDAHSFKVLPMESEVLKIVIRAADSEVKTIQQSLLEQYITLVVTDDSVPFSINVSRVSIMAVEIDAEEETYDDERHLLPATPPKPDGDIAVENSMIQALASTTTAVGHATADGGPGAADAAGGAAPAPATAKPGMLGEGKAAFPQQVLSLKNCIPMQGCTGAYALSLSFPREDAPQTDIGIRNNLTDRSVEYTVSVTSQSPQPWLLAAGTMKLEPGETQNLRLSILSVDAGSFVSYLSISNSANPSEMVYLRLSAEVFLPSAGEGLFEIISSTGQRVTSNTTRTVSMGHLYGGGAHRPYIALEIVNRGNLALEFPVSVVKPFRLELKPLRHQGLHGGAHGHHEHRPKDALGEKALVSNTSALFDGKLVVCHIYGVPTASRQKYIVVDPKSRVRLTFLLTCNQLNAPPGYGVAGEADVVFRCKETRDSHFTFKAKFELYPPTFQVENEYFLTVDATKACGEASVVVRNLLNVAQSFAFRTQSPVLYVVAGTGSPEEDVSAFNTVMDSAAVCPASFATIEVPARSSGYFAVRVDSMRAAALLNFDKNEGAHPILIEHAHILNVGNPMERVHLQFHQSSEGSQSAMMTAIRPVKVGGQYISEHYIIRFVQQFTSTMSQCEERLVALFKFYEGRKTTDATHVPSMSTTSSDEDESEPHNRSIQYDASLDQASVLSSEDAPDSTARRAVQRGSPQTSADTSRPARLSPAEWQAIHVLLLDLTWLVDELVYYSILLCNSRRIDSYCSFVTAAVMNHPVMRAWRQTKRVFPINREEGVFAQFVEALDALPCPSPSLSSS
ncbi:hypothetical protein STCU_09805 [Strigomonas culicis]|uniref:Uncharacterized protein n=1 Tax=Strigomonas culicis TaxID=28005 RepID=S9UW04_9TRYP|nr:hypothetical protein STCU_09805 [Strigomonas culicis]|eukprot:EPY18711.1 hypothetical protein STCU_09805 [Strigomonas culicis]